jgi:integral membrane sensor domain MASE1
MLFGGSVVSKKFTPPWEENFIFAMGFFHFGKFLWPSFTLGTTLGERALLKSGHPSATSLLIWAFILVMPLTLVLYPAHNGPLNFASVI